MNDQDFDDEILRATPRKPRVQSDVSLKYFGRVFIILMIVAGMIYLTNKTIHVVGAYLWPKNDVVKSVVTEDPTTNTKTELALIVKRMPEAQKNEIKEINETKEIADNKINIPTEENVKEPLLQEEHLELKKVSQILEKAPTPTKQETKIISPAKQEKVEKMEKVIEEKKLTTDEKKLLKASAHHYSIELFASDNKESLELFVNEKGLSSSSYIYRKFHTGKPKYILIYGDYQSREIAEEALSVLSEDLLEKAPSISSIAAIQEAIRAK